jgi:hypothetical protein
VEVKLVASRLSIGAVEERVAAGAAVERVAAGVVEVELAAVAGRNTAFSFVFLFVPDGMMEIV